MGTRDGRDEVAARRAEAAAAWMRDPAVRAAIRANHATARELRRAGAARQAPT